MESKKRKLSGDCYFAVDCEMVACGTKDALARCVIVDKTTEVVFDKYVKPREFVTDYRSAISGINGDHINGQSAITFLECQRQVRDIIEGRIIVGHSIDSDLKVLEIDHPLELIRDTATYSTFCPSK